LFFGKASPVHHQKMNINREGGTMDGSEERKLADEDQFGDDDQFWKRVAQEMAWKKRQLHDRRIERLQWSLLRLKLGIADKSAQLEYQQKLGAELAARLDAAVAAL